MYQTPLQKDEEAGFPLEMNGQQFLLLFILFVLLSEINEIISENLLSLIVARRLLLSKHSHG